MWIVLDPITEGMTTCFAQFHLNTYPGEVLASEASLDEASAVVNHNHLVEIEVSLHLIQTLLDS